MKLCSAFVLAVLLLPRVQEDEHAALLRALGSDIPEERERAAAALETKGAQAMDALRKAADAGDTEVALRAREILIRIRIGLWNRPVLGRTDALVPFGRADRFCVSSDGKIAAGCDLSHVSLWSVPDGRLLQTWPVHPWGMLRVDLNREGTKLISWTGDEASLWEVPSGRLIRSYPSHSHRPRTVKVSPNGKYLAVGGWRELRWIEAATGKVAWSWKPHGRSGVDLDLSPDGLRVAVVSSNVRDIPILSTVDGSVLQKFEAPTTGSRSTIDFSPDAMAIVVTNWDHSVAWRFSAEDGHEEKKGILEDRFVFQGRKARFQVTRPHYPKPGDEKVTLMMLTGPEYDSPERVVLSRDDRIVAAMTLNGKEVQLFETEKGGKVRDIGSNLKSFAMGADGILGGTRDGCLVLYNLEGRELRRASHGKGAVDFVAFAGEGRTLSMGEDLVLRCVDLATGSELWKEDYFRLGNGPYRFHPDGRHVLGNQEDERQQRRQVVRFEAATGRVVQTYGKFDGYVAGIGVSPDGTLVAASGRDGPLAVWESESGKKLWEIRPGKNARLVLFTPDSSSLVTGNDEGKLVRYEAKTGKEETVYPVTEKSQFHEGAISSDGRILAVLGGKGPELFDLKGGAFLQKFSGPWQGGIAFLEGGRKAIYGMSGALVDLESGKTLQQFTTKGVRRAHPDPSRTRLGALMEDGRFVLMELSTGKILRDLVAPEKTFDFVLGPEGGPIVFLGEFGRYLKSDPEPSGDKVDGTNLDVLGADGEKERLFVRGKGGVEVRDLRTLKPSKEIDLGDVKRVAAPAGSPYAFVYLRDRVFRLDRETLAPIGEVVSEIPLIELDESGGVLLAGTQLFDGAHGKVRGLIRADCPQPLIASFFGPRGESVILVSSNGIVTTLHPGR